MSAEPDHPELSAVEMLNAVRNVGAMAYALFVQLVEEGLSEADALRLTGAYLHGMAGGKLG